MPFTPEWKELPGQALLTQSFTVPAPTIFDRSTPEEFERMLSFLPGRVQVLVKNRIREVEEIKMQAHGPVEVLYRHAHVVYDVTLDDKDLVGLDSIGTWRSDGRLGMEGTLHRFGRRATNNKTSLVTVRVAKDFVGLAEPLRPWLSTAQDGLVILGLPGDGKTTLLRDCLRILAERLAGRLFVGDSSKEILGDGYQPHPSMDWLSRVTVDDISEQFEVLNQILKNFQPGWMAVDEISRLEDAQAIAYARSRGVKAVMTWHAGSLTEAYAEKDPRTLWPLIRRNDQGLTGPPVARLGIQILRRGDYLVFEDLERAFDAVAKGMLPQAVRVTVNQDGRWAVRTKEGRRFSE